jgi:hypothetical protein
MDEFWNLLLGEISKVMFLVGMIYAALGWFGYKGLSYQFRDKDSDRTPPEHSWSFWWKDNWKEGAWHFILLFCAVRFPQEAVKIIQPAGLDFFEHADNMMIYLLLGIGVAIILEKRKKDKLKKQPTQGTDG